MRKAGAAVARQAELMTRPGDRIVFLAGKGHNGDDTAYACEAVQNRSCELLRIVDPEFSDHALTAQLARKPALLVDGLFGIGLNRPLAGNWMKLIENLNRAGVPILSVDVPSGLSADSGLPLDLAIRADVTLTFGAVKQGLLRANASPFVGRLEVAEEIGLVPYPFSTEVGISTASDFQRFPPGRPMQSNKGTFGHVAIVAGSMGYHGAAVLAARAAQRAQPGLITVCPHEPVYLPVASQLQAAMVKPWSTDVALPENTTAIVAGPGLAAPDLPETLRHQLRRLWMSSPLPMILDASALLWLPEGPTPDPALRVITPHPGEAARLLESSVTEVQRDRVGAARELSQRWGNCHVILKGHQTVTLQGKGEVLLNSSGNPWLGQGGSGDALAGFLGGLLAQPELQKQAMLALRYGVWEHGAAADRLRATKPSFTVEELVDELAAGGPR